MIDGFVWSRDISLNRQPQTINENLNYWNNLHYWLNANEQVLPG